VKELFELLNELRKWSRREGEEKSKKGNPSHQLPLPVEWSLVIQWGWMPEAEEDNEDEQEKPSRVVENGNEGHDSDSDDEDGSAPLSKEGIGNVASV